VRRARGGAGRRGGARAGRVRDDGLHDEGILHGGDDPQPIAIARAGENTGSNPVGATTVVGTESHLRDLRHSLGRVKRAPDRVEPAYTALRVLRCEPSGASPPTARPASQQVQPMDRCSTRCAHAIIDSSRTIGGGGMTLRRRATTVYPGGPSTPALPSFARPGPPEAPGASPPRPGAGGRAPPTGDRPAVAR